MEANEKGELWSGWRTVRVIGRGSYGAVYEIERRVLDRTEKAALKHISLPQDERDLRELYDSGYDTEGIRTHYRECLSDLVREYQLMVSMKGHTNVVCCDDIRYEPKPDGIGWDVYIRMELLTPLTGLLERGLSEMELRKLGADLCRALVLCESRGILHRDIKPQNIFVSADGDFKLGDFGVAKTVERTSGGTKIGTYNYMAPEVYNNQPYGHSADLYSLGIVLYWLLNDRRMPFVPPPPAVPKASELETARLRRFRGEALPAPAHGSEGLRRIVLKACAYDPKDRYHTAGEMLADLTAPEAPAPRAARAGAAPEATVGVQRAPGAPARPAPQPPRQAAPPKKKKARPWLIAALIAVALPLGFFAARALGSAVHTLVAAEPTPTPSPTIVVPEFVLEPPTATIAPTPEPGAAKPSGLGTPVSAVFPGARSLAPGESYTLGLRSDGTVVSVGYNESGRTGTAGWTDIVSLSACGQCSLGLRSDGTVVVAGSGDYSQEDVASWTDIVQVEAGWMHALGLRSDGTVLAVGNRDSGRCDVAGWTDIVAVSAGGSHSLGLRSDGTVVAVGSGDSGACDVGDWRDMVAVVAGYGLSLGLRSDGTVAVCGDDGFLSEVSAWTDIVDIALGQAYAAGLRSDGTVVTAGSNAYGQRNVDAWTDIVQIAVNRFAVFGLRSDGTVVAAGGDTFGESEVSGWTDIRLP